MAQLVSLSNADIDSDYNFEDYDARDTSGDKMGSIDSVIVDSATMQPRYLVVDSGGWFSSSKYAVPMGEVDHVDDDDHNVFFRTLTKDQLKSGTYPEYDDSWWDNNNGQAFGDYEQRWSDSYNRGVSNARPSSTASTDTQAVSGTTAAGRAMKDQRGVDYNSDLYRRPTQNGGRLQLLEEHLSANKERYQAGTVKLGKRVLERQEAISVPVSEDRVVIERRPVTNGEAVDQTIGQDQTLEVPIERERVNVQKKVVPTEEVGLRKETVQHNERVQDTVRKEELDIQDHNGLLDHDGTGVSDREGATPDPALRGRPDLATSPNSNEGRIANDAERTGAGSVADGIKNATTATESDAAHTARGVSNQGRSAIDSARSDTPGAP